MALQLLLWILSFLMNCGLLAMGFHAIICFTDLESDYLNPFEATVRLNKWVLPEFLLQGFLCALFLLTGHWFMFLLSAPLAAYHLMLFMKREHLIDVTEVFRNLKFEIKSRWFKLACYLLFFSISIVRFVLVVFELIRNEDHDIHVF